MIEVSVRVESEMFTAAVTVEAPDILDIETVVQHTAVVIGTLKDAQDTALAGLDKARADELDDVKRELDTDARLKFDQ